MTKLTFRESMVLTEGRREDLTYTDKVVKNQIDRVTTVLSGNDSGAFTRLAARFDRLATAIERMAKKRDEIHGDLKTKVTELFNAEDVIYTRVVETAQFTMTLAKAPPPKPEDNKKVVNYEKIAEELAKLVSSDLEEQVKNIYEQYTSISIAKPKDPALRVVKKVDESITEGVVDKLKSIMAKGAKFMKDIARWAVSYDKKLAALKQQFAG